MAPEKLQTHQDTAIPLEKWLRRVQATSKRRAWGSQNHLKQRGAFRCASASGTRSQNTTPKFFQVSRPRPLTKHLAVAKSVLDNFDAVLILERLSTEEGRDEAEALLGKLLPTPPAERARARRATST